MVDRCRTQSHIPRPSRDNERPCHKSLMQKLPVSVAQQDVHLYTQMGFLRNQQDVFLSTTCSELALADLKYFPKNFSFNLLCTCETARRVGYSFTQNLRGEGQTKNIS